MALNSIRIGDYVTLIKEKCNIHNLSPDDVSGINRDKEFFEPSKQVGGDTSNYKNVPPGCFACNLMHVGRDCVLPIALNRTSKNKIVSPAYTVFRMNENDKILVEYFFIFLKSQERDRYFWFHCDSSVRDGMEWEDFCNIKLEIPSIDIQKKYVDIYKGLLANLRSYEKGLEDLKLVCNGCIENLRKNSECESIINFIEERVETNKKKETTLIKGVGLKGFIEPNQARSNESLEKCNLFYKGDFVYAPSSLKNGVISYNDRFDKAICTEEYVVFKIRNLKIMDPYYLLMWLKRKQLGRYIDFSSCDSVRNRFYFKDLSIIEIPIPTIEMQLRLSKIYQTMLMREKIGSQLKKQINDICPILVRGSIDDGR